MVMLCMTSKAQQRGSDTTYAHCYLFYDEDQQSVVTAIATERTQMYGMISQYMDSFRLAQSLLTTSISIRAGLLNHLYADSQANYFEHIADTLKIQAGQRMVNAVRNIARINDILVSLSNVVADHKRRIRSTSNYTTHVPL